MSFNQRVKAEWAQETALSIKPVFPMETRDLKRDLYTDFLSLPLFFSLHITDRFSENTFLGFIELWMDGCFYYFSE